MNTQFTGSFAKDLRRIPLRALRDRIRLAIEQVEAARSLHEVANLKKLHGHDSHYRLRVGEYRIGLTLEGDIVTFVRVLHRKDIYRQFP